MPAPANPRAKWHTKANSVYLITDATYLLPCTARHHDPDPARYTRVDGEISLKLCRDEPGTVHLTFHLGQGRGAPRRHWSCPRVTLAVSLVVPTTYGPVQLRLDTRAGSPDILHIEPGEHGAHARILAGDIRYFLALVDGAK